METEVSPNCLLLVAACFFLFVAGLVIADSLLPDGCLLFENRQIGLLCDGIDLENPRP